MINNTVRWAIIRAQMEGIHQYPNAPEEVAFLRHPHRHIFHVILYVEQFHDERDVEYLMARKWLDNLLHATKWDISSSCEHIAMVVGQTTRSVFRDRRVKIEVTEDGENGCLIEMS